jgi:hypothetical protein
MTRAIRRAVTAGALLLGAAACTISREAPPPPSSAEASPAHPLRVVPHAYLARGADQDWWETIHPAEAGEEFLLYLQPKLLAPAEGPWTLTVRSADGRVVARVPTLRVDPATGRLALLGRTASFPAGDYTLDLELEPGGLTHGPERQQFRFRVQGP